MLGLFVFHVVKTHNAVGMSIRDASDLMTLGINIKFGSITEVSPMMYSKYPVHAGLFVIGFNYSNFD